MAHRCEWTFYEKAKNRKGPFPKCEKRADFVKPTERTREPWYLCREHCELLVNSYNEKTQLTERPKWRAVL